MSPLALSAADSPAWTPGKERVLYTGHRFAAGKGGRIRAKSIPEQDLQALREHSATGIAAFTRLKQKKPAADN